MLEQSGLRDKVKMVVEENNLEAQSSQPPRQDWEASFITMAILGDDQLLDQDHLTQWDENEWTW
jgi:hypothetical protein